MSGPVQCGKIGKFYYFLTTNLVIKAAPILGEFIQPPTNFRTKFVAPKKVLFSKKMTLSFFQILEFQLFMFLSPKCWSTNCWLCFDLKNLYEACNVNPTQLNGYIFQVKIPNTKWLPSFSSVNFSVEIKHRDRVTTISMKTSKSIPWMDYVIFLCSSVNYSK